jgi:hypothetical protein
MTYWATLWYSGAVVLQLGYEGQSIDECLSLTRTMTLDLEQSYAEPENIDPQTLSMFPTNEFAVSCEVEKLDIDEKYTIEN